MRVTVIGAGGFVGARVVAQLAEMAEVTEIRAMDRVPVAAGPKIIAFQGDFSQPSLRDPAVDGADAVICLASILGGAAEADYALARRVNVDATLDLIDHLKATAPGTRFVFASTIAAYGKPLPDPVTDATPLGPSMVYGAQKVMLEVALSNFATRG